jgi:hypothetical protein
MDLRLSYLLLGATLISIYNASTGEYTTMHLIIVFLLSILICVSLLYLYDYLTKCQCDSNCRCMIDGVCRYNSVGKSCKCGCNMIEGFQGSYLYPYDYSSIYYWPAGYWYTGCNETMFGDVKCLPHTSNPYW